MKFAHSSAPGAISESREIRRTPSNNKDFQLPDSAGKRLKPWIAPTVEVLLVDLTESADGNGIDVTSGHRHPLS